MAENPNDRLLLSGKNMSMSFDSGPINVSRNLGFTFQAIWTGVPVGYFYISESSDSIEDPTFNPPVNFTEIPTTRSSTFGGPGTLVETWIYQLNFNWVKFVYVAQGGNGILQSLRFNGR